MRSRKLLRPKCGSTQRPSFVRYIPVKARFASWFESMTSSNPPSSFCSCRYLLLHSAAVAALEFIAIDWR